MFVSSQNDEADRLTWKQETQEENDLVIRTYSQDDFEGIQEMEKVVYPPPWPQDDLWSVEQLQSHVDVFEEGALCAEYEEEIVGTMTTFITDGVAETDHTWEAVTDHGYLAHSHNEAGDTLYVADLQVNPLYRKLGIGKQLMFKGYELVQHLGLRRLIGAVRMPGYCAYAAQLTPEQYVSAVVAGRLKDPVITFMMHCGRIPLHVVHNYLHDVRSGNNALLMEWRNPDFH